MVLAQVLGQSLTTTESSVASLHGARKGQVAHQVSRDVLDQVVAAVKGGGLATTAPGALQGCEEGAGLLGANVVGNQVVLDTRSVLDSINM